MVNDDTKKISQALKVATLYYRDGYNQQDIATELNISRATVSRLLQFGRDQGLVTVKINNPLAPDPEKNNYRSGEKGPARRGGGCRCPLPGRNRPG